MTISPGIEMLPVIDLKGGTVVRGIGGRRDEYRPIRSVLAAGADPGQIARAMAGRCGFREAYVADLDAIGGAAPDWLSLRAIGAAGLRVALDAGLRSSGHAREVVQQAPAAASVDRWIVGLESVASAAELAAILAVLGPDRGVFSLDLKNGRPLSQSAEWSAMRPQQIAARAVEIGFREIIVLDLAAVGAVGGPNSLDLCRSLCATHPEVRWIGGGGVRDARDLQRFRDAGCHRVLIASALHDGRLPGEEFAGSVLP